ncbi:MAG: tetratricopeptide repeat protein [Candidatus Marinimicrobia bacterium]|nr:tetratricopeptide repeat protein [Candidatus Neomarinimicrobiota bacterium]
MKRILILVLIFSFSGLFAQENTLKEKALEKFKKEHYNEAIDLLEQAVKISPDDAEIYYYLGFFNHYRAYDSRPLRGYDFSYSEKIFEYLDKAIELNPNYGDAKYFYGAECSGNAFISMQNDDLKQLKYFYKLAYKKGAYPDWLLEFGRNMLIPCDKNAILFTAGNADFDVCSYLQLHEKFRTDITIIPIANINRPWYVNFLKKGLKNGIRKISINLTEEQIMDIHPFKWDTTTVAIPVSEKLKKKYELDENYKMQWKIEPDLFSMRKHSKIAGEEVKKRTYLSPQRAMLLQIVEDNFSNRPIYFSNMASHLFYGGLDSFFRNCGLVSELLPVQTEKTEYENNYHKIQQLLQSENFKDYSTIKENDIPRISRIIYNYYYTFLELAEYYKNNNKTEKLEELISLFKQHLTIGFSPNHEKIFEMKLERIKN